MPSLPAPARVSTLARVKWIRDSHLDRAVLSHKQLLPVLTLEDLLLRRLPRHSLPLSSIPSPLHRIVSLYPSCFSLSHRRVSPTPSLSRLHGIERLTHLSTLRDSADRLLRLLMLSRSLRIPLRILDLLRFDLALPRDFASTLLPVFPDFFYLSASDSEPSSELLYLRLTSYNPDLAVSALQRSSSFRFPHRLPRGFDLNSKSQAWIDHLNGLPYLSPYENMTHLDWGSPIAEKWVVGVIHEMLHLMVSKRLELGVLAEVAGLAGIKVGVVGMRKVVLRYPGIFYLCNKIGVQTVVLKEAFKREVLVVKHPMMSLRYRYMKLMRGGMEKESDNRCEDEEEESDDRCEDENVDGDENADERIVGGGVSGVGIGDFM